MTTKRKRLKSGLDAPAAKPLVPNAETIKAMQEARRGETKKFATVAALMQDLHD